MKSRTTKRSSDPVTNCSPPFRNQKGKNLVWKKENPIALRRFMLLKATRKLVRTISAIFSVILRSKRLSFLQVKGNGLLLAPTLHAEDICLHRYPRSSRSRRTRRRWILSLGYREIGVAEGVCTEWSRRIF